MVKYPKVRHTRMEGPEARGEDAELKQMGEDGEASECWCFSW